MILYLPLFVLAVLVSLGMSHLVMRLCVKYGIFDYPDHRKLHAKPTPHLGGIALFVSFWILFLLASLHFDAINLELSGRMWALFLASAVILVTGIVDDLKNLNFVGKLSGQLIAAGIIIAAGFTIPRFYIPFWGSLELGWLSYPMTAAWIIVLSNSINLIDGLDGLAGSVSVSVCFGMFVTGLLLGVETVIATTVCLSGSIVGFLILNRPPARLFMGDSGALFIGFMFSVLAVICPVKSYTAVAMFVPLVAVGVPLIEVAVTLVRRTASGQRFYVADNRHIHNYLVNLGFSRERTVMILTCISLALTAFVPALFWFDRKRVFSIFIAFLLILFVSFFVLRLKHEQDRVDGKRNST